jgi:hypothetical protein
MEVVIWGPWAQVPILKENKKKPEIWVQFWFWKPDPIQVIYTKKNLAKAEN